MKCPVDGTVLAISERRGIEVDYCPECRGVWLDRGELDKLLDRAADELPPYQPPPPVHQPPPPYETYQPRDPKQRKKKKSFLSDFFEFD